MNSLIYFQSKLHQRSRTLESAHLRFLSRRAGLKKNDRFAIQEGLTSELWQAWNGFSRSIVIWSLKGCTTASGATTSSAYSACSIDEIRYLAMKAARNETIGKPRPILGDHTEPTWGDPAKINNILSKLSPSNCNQLLSAFGSSITISDLQKIRNACAHISADRIADVRSLQVRYDKNNFMHPSDALFWIEPNTGDFAWSAWLSEMNIIAAAAVV